MSNIYVTGIDLSKTTGVLLIASEDMNAQEGFQLKMALEKEFPRVKFVVLAGDIKAVTTTDVDAQYEIEG